MAPATVTSPVVPERRYLYRPGSLTKITPYHNIRPTTYSTINVTHCRNMNSGSQWPV